MGSQGEGEQEREIHGSYRMEFIRSNRGLEFDDHRGIICGVDLLLDLFCMTLQEVLSLLLEKRNKEEAESSLVGSWGARKGR